jgi:hypothetical protein
MHGMWSTFCTSTPTCSQKHSLYALALVSHSLQHWVCVLRVVQTLGCRYVSLGLTANAQLNTCLLLKVLVSSVLGKYTAECMPTDADSVHLDKYMLDAC